MKCLGSLYLHHEPVEMVEEDEQYWKCPHCEVLIRKEG